MAILPTFQELYDSARAEVQARRPDLTDWTEGSALDAITGGGTVLADEAMRISTEQFGELFFDTAEGEALDRLILDRFNETRFIATAAVGTVQWTRDAAGSYTILAGTKFRATVNGVSITVQSTSTIEMLTSDTTVDVPVEATVAGRSSNAAADTITEIIDTVIADPDATCNNDQPLAGGIDTETDDQVRDRIRRIYSTLRRATVAALETGARSVPGVFIVTVDESFVESSGYVYVYVGDPDGRSNDVLADAVSAELLNWRAAGVRVEVLASEREEVALSVRVAIEFGADRNAVGAAVRAAIVGYGNTLGANERARTSRIQNACHDASELVVAADLDTSAAALTPSEPQKAIRFVADQISLAFVEVT